MTLTKSNARHTGIPRLRSFCLIFALAAITFNGNSSENGQYIPKAPDYADDSMWYISKNDKSGKGADVLYFVSTWATDQTTENGQTSHYADVYNANLRSNMNKEISKIAGYMGENNNFYSPYYRHITIETWATLNEDTVNSRFSVTNNDIQNAFKEFLHRREPQRPFILAGFSQGGKAVVEILKSMPEELHKYLVAAYVLGYKVTPEDTLATSNIRAAQYANDTGVTICYNSVSDSCYIKPIVASPCAMCINPVNWRTDAVPAILNDTITVTAEPDRHVLVVNGYRNKYAPILGFLNVGDFHSAEPWLYEECLRKNIRTRIEAYYKRHY